MATTLIEPNDLAAFITVDESKLVAMIEDVSAKAISVAPCLATATDQQVLATAKAILRQAIIRWHDTDTGVVTNQGVGPFSQSITPLKGIDSGVRRSGLLWPSEITDLQALCRQSGGGGAYTVDALPAQETVHADICSLRFDPTRGCSCGAVLTQYAPLWENR